MTVDVALIGGTRIGGLLAELGGNLVRVPTRLGMMGGRLITVGDIRLVAIQRHSLGHKRPPHAVNYGAIALGLTRLGVRACISTAAVGSLRSDWVTGTLAVCSDFVDFSGRNHTIFSSSVVHTDVSAPFDRAVMNSLLDSDARLSQAVYVQTNGPRYETPREVALLSNHGDVVGMTAASEAIAMREAGVPYGCLAVVTNLAAGLSTDRLSHEEVVEEMGRSGRRALDILLAAAAKLTEAK